jgi:HAE1 family hydrophobic/amphiphilic exporter-1
VPPELDRGVLALSTHRPVAMLMIVATALIFGTIAFTQLPRNLMPDIAYPTITVRTEYSGAAPVDVEDRISERLESVLSQVKNLRRISSISRAEISEIILEFAWGTHMGHATSEVREKIDQAVLPDDVERPIILRYDPTLDPVLQLGFYQGTGDGKPLSREGEIESLIDLRIKAEEVIEKDLELVDGVAAVEVRGGYAKEIRIDVDEDLIAAKEIGIDLISRRVGEENQNLASGILYEGDDSLIVRSVNEFRGLEEIRDIVLRRQGNVPIRLRDVAKVEFGFKDPEVLTRFNGHPCVKIDVYKEADANLVEVARSVRDRVYGTRAERDLLARLDREEAEKRKQSEAVKLGAQKPGGSKKRRVGGPGGMLFPIDAPGGPPKRPDYLSTRLERGEQVVVMSDQSRFIQNALDEVSSTVVSGGLLAIAVLYLFLRRLWFTTIVGLSIPLSLIATFAVLKLCGVSLNIMSLGGLALGVGMLVDNSIVVLESIFRCRQRGDGARLAAVRGGREVALAVTASTLTTVAVFFPIVFVEGIAGQVFRDQALAVVISLVVSLAVALTFIPSLVARSFGGGPVGHTSEAQRAPWPHRLTSWRRLREFIRGKNAVMVALLFPILVPMRLLHLIIEAAGLLVLGLALAAGSIGRRLWRAGANGGRVVVGPLLDAFDRLWSWTERSYPALLARALQRRRAVLLSIGAAAVVALYLFTRMGSELIPEVHQGEFTVEVTLPVGTRLEQTDLRIRPIEQAIAKDPDIESVTATIGVEKDSLKAGEEGEHTARILVRLRSGRTQASIEEEVKSRIRAIFADVPDVAVKVRNPSLFSFRAPIEVEFKGFRLDALREVADALKESMDRIESIKDVKSTLQRGYPEVQLRFDRDLLMRYNLDVGKIGNAIRRKIEGEVPTRFTEGDRKVDLRVRLRENDRSSLEDLRSLTVSESPGQGEAIYLYDVATIDQDFGPSEIRRIGQSRAAVVSANLAGLDLGRASAEIAAAIDELEVPPGITVGFGGQQSELERSSSSLMWALALAVFLVYVVMAAQFESLVQPFVVLFSVPLAAVGVAPVLWGLGVPHSILTFVGLIILAGVVVNNAIVLVDCINRLRKEGAPKLDAIAQAGRLRLRPILMTTSTTVLGLVPLTGILNWVPGATLLLGTGEGLELRTPMAWTVIAGLTSSTLLTLVVVPIVYSFTDRRT